MRTEDELRAAFLALEAEAPDTDELFARLTAGAGSSRTRRARAPERAGRWRVAVLAGIAAAAVVAGSLLYLRPGADQRSTTAGPRPVPAGMREVSFHGVAIDVPAGWANDAARCGTPVKNTVIYSGFFASCRLVNPPVVSSVGLNEPQPSDLDIAGLTDSRSATVRVDNTKVLQTLGRRGILHVVILRVASAKAVIDISSPDESLAARLAATVHLISADTNGCAVTAHNATHLITGKKPARAGANAQLIPAGATAIVACRYQAGLLERGSLLLGGTAEKFITSINSIPAGFSRAQADSYSQSSCRSSTTDPGSVSGERAFDSESYVLTASYPSGPPVGIVLRLGECGNLGAANGTRSAQRTSTLVQLIQSTGIGPNQPWSTVVPAP